MSIPLSFPWGNKREKIDTKQWGPRRKRRVEAVKKKLWREDIFKVCEVDLGLLSHYLSESVVRIVTTAR